MNPCAGELTAERLQEHVCDHGALLLGTLVQNRARTIKQRRGVQELACEGRYKERMRRGEGKQKRSRAGASPLQGLSRRINIANEEREGKEKRKRSGTSRLRGVTRRNQHREMRRGEGNEKRS
jgi:hypothetical protein